VAGLPPLFLFARKTKEVKPLGEYTHIHNRFEWWSVEDCACEHCVNYAGKNRSCPLEACAVADIRQEALRREQAAHSGLTGRKEAAPCPA